MMSLRPLFQAVKEVQVIGPRADVVRYAAADAYRLRCDLSAVYDTPTFDWPVIRMGQIHVLHWCLLAVAAAQGNVYFLCTGVKLYQRRRSIVLREGHRMPVLPTQAYVCAAFIFPQYKPSMLKDGVGQLTMQGMVILLRRHAHRRKPAVEQKPAVGLKIV